MENSRLSKENQVMQVELQRIRSPSNSDGFGRAPALPWHRHEGSPQGNKTNPTDRSSQPLTLPYEEAQKGFFITEDLSGTPGVSAELSSS